MDAPLATCQQRNAARPASVRVPEAVLARMAAGFEAPLEHDASMPILRLDGTMPVSELACVSASTLRCKCEDLQYHHVSVYAVPRTFIPVHEGKLAWQLQVAAELAQFKDARYAAQHLMALHSISRVATCGCLCTLAVTHCHGIAMQAPSLPRQRHRRGAVLDYNLVSLWCRRCVATALQQPWRAAQLPRPPVAQPPQEQSAVHIFDLASRALLSKVYSRWYVQDNNWHTWQLVHLTVAVQPGSSRLCACLSCDTPMMQGLPVDCLVHFSFLIPNSTSGIGRARLRTEHH